MFELPPPSSSDFAPPDLGHPPSGGPSKGWKFIEVFFALQRQVWHRLLLKGLRWLFFERKNAEKCLF